MLYGQLASQLLAMSQQIRPTGQTLPKAGLFQFGPCVKDVYLFLKHCKKPKKEYPTETLSGPPGLTYYLPVCRKKSAKP